MGNICCATTQNGSELNTSYLYYKVCVLELPLESSQAHKERYTRETLNNNSGEGSNIHIQIWKKNKDFGYGAEAEAINNIFYQGCDAVLIKISSELKRGQINKEADALERIKSAKIFVRDPNNHLKNALRDVFEKGKLHYIQDKEVQEGQDYHHSLITKILKQEKREPQTADFDMDMTQKIIEKKILDRKFMDDKGDKGMDTLDVNNGGGNRMPKKSVFGGNDRFAKRQSMINDMLLSDLMKRG